MVPVQPRADAASSEIARRALRCPPRCRVTRARCRRSWTTSRPCWARSPCSASAWGTRSWARWAPGAYYIGPVPPAQPAEFTFMERRSSRASACMQIHFARPSIWVMQHQVAGRTILAGPSKTSICCAGGGRHDLQAEVRAPRRQPPHPAQQGRWVPYRNPNPNQNPAHPCNLLDPSYADGALQS